MVSNILLGTVRHDRQWMFAKYMPYYGYGCFSLAISENYVVMQTKRGRDLDLSSDNWWWIESGMVIELQPWTYGTFGGISVSKGSFRLNLSAIFNQARQTGRHSHWCHASAHEMVRSRTQNFSSTNHSTLWHWLEELKKAQASSWTLATQTQHSNVQAISTRSLVTGMCPRTINHDLTKSEELTVWIIRLNIPWCIITHQ